MLKRLGTALIALAASITLAFGQAYVPSVKIGTAALITPSAAESYYGSGTTSTNGLGAQVRPPEIVELARALKNDPDLIHEYVRNNIEVVWLYGLQKGALGASIDKSGTAFDQAMLMVELLRQAGHTASYKQGTLTLTGAQFTAWSGISDANAACQLLANGGIPGSVNGASGVCGTGASGSISSVVLAHMWVSVTISGTNYVFDPAYKPHTWKSGINLATAMGMTAGQPLAQATSGMTTGSQSGASYVRTLNMGALSSTLQGYATNLLAYLNTNNLAAAEMEDIIGGGKIQNYTSPSGGLRQTSLPYTSSATNTWSGGIPDQYRTTLRTFVTTPNHQSVANADNPVQIDTMFDRTFYVDEIYGRRLALDTNFKQGLVTQYSHYPTNTVWLKLDDAILNTATIVPVTATPPMAQYSARGSIVTVQLTANHPYAVAADGTATANGAYMDGGVEKVIQLTTGASIVHGWGHTSPALLAKWSDERDSDSALPRPVDPPGGCEGGSAPCISDHLQSAGEFTREKTGANWLAQLSRSAALHAAIAKSVHQHHRSIGVVYGDTHIQPSSKSSHFAGRQFPASTVTQYSIGDSFDRIDIDSAVSLTSKAANASERRAGLHAIAATAAALEGSIAAQMSDLPDTSSTATRFEWGNAPPASEDPSSAGARKFFEFSSSNASAASGLVLAENMTSTTQTGEIAYGTQPILGTSEVTARRTAVSNAVTAYANAGFTIATSQETFLGPGQRGGALITRVVCEEGIWGGSGCYTVYQHKESKQRGGALVATRYVNSEPVEIAHILVAPETDGKLTKGGGGGNEPEAKTKYDPGEAADVLKARFVDKSSALGVTLSNGQMSYESPASISVGSGKFPYALSASLSWRAGAPPTQKFGPTVASQPQAGWTTNWHNSLSVSGSGMEAMGQTDVRFAASTLAAFVAAQDVYKAAPSLSREVAGTLTQSWWVKGLTANVVSVSLGRSTTQFLRLPDGSYMSPGAGPQSTLVWTGARTPYERICTNNGAPTPPYALTRGWNYSSVSFAITNSGGDVQSFGRWQAEHWDGVGFCGLMQGFHLNSWSFPQGVTITATHETNELNATHRLKEVTNSLGRKLRFNYDTYSGELVGIDDGSTRALAISMPSGYMHAPNHADPVGNVTAYSYLTEVVASATQRPVPYRRLEKVFTADNATKANVQYTYDGVGRVKEVRDATALQWETRGPYQFFIADGTRGERVDPAGGAFAVTYDVDGRPWRYSDEIGRKTEVFYDGRGRMARYVYPELDEELLEYDDRNNATKLTKVAKPSCTTACSQVIEAAWHTAWNKPLWVKDQMGRQSDFTYFETGNGKSLIATAQRPAVGGTRPEYSFTYDNRGLPLTATDPTGLISQNTYDATNGNLLSTIVNPSGIAITSVMAYDTIGNVTQTTDPRGNIATTTYDANRGKLVAIAYLGATTGAPLGAATRTTYDAVGRVITEEKATAFSGATPTWGHVTQLAYTPTGQKAKVTDADGRVTSMLYDAVDRLSVAIDPESRRVRKVYDLAGQLLQEIRADASPLQQVYAEYSYTANGLQAWIKDAKGNQTTYTYDGFDRPSRTTFPDATYEDLSYDAKGNVLSKLTRGGQLIQNTYDTLDRAVTHLVPQPGGASAILTTTTYDLAGRPTQISDNTGHSLTTAFDTAKRPVSVTQAAPTFTGTRVVSYQLDAAGNKTRTTWADGYYVQYAYDQLGRMTTATENGTYLLATYIYDPLSRRTSLVYGNGTTKGYSYTTQGDLLTLAHTLSGTANTYTNTFTKAHQLQTEAASNAAWQHVPAVFQTTAYSAANNLNQYVNVTVGSDPAVTLGYDANGNLTGDGTWTFAYDAQNMLRTAAKAGTSAAYAYDTLGRRQAKTVNAVVTTFLHDGNEEIAEYDGANTLLRRYVPGPGTDMPIAMVTPGGGGTNTRAYFHVNRQGSTIAMSADNGTLSEGPYTYDAYGNGAPTTGVPFKYTGRKLDPETGLYYYRARYYSASLGRFLQVDPVGYGDQMNLYAYVGNDPTNAADPSGEATLYLNLEGEGKVGSLVRDILESTGMYSDNAYSTGVSGSVGVAVSFPLFDGAEFDAGVVLSGGVTDVKTESDGSPLVSLPGASVGLEAGMSSGSVKDLRGQSITSKVQSNIGRWASRKVVGGLSKIAPNGPIKNFVDGPLAKGADAMFGLIVSGGFVSGKNEAGETNYGVEVGLKKGFNAGGSADLEVSAVCSVRTGCR